MTTNQEGRQAAIRDSTSSAYGVAADWHALFDDAGISAGTFNERLLAWINDQLGTSYSNLLGAMAAYAADAGYNAWSSISTLVLGGASTLLSGETDGLAFDFTDSSARIKDTSTPANEYSSTGIVSSGSLVGPSGKLTYTSASNKLTLQSDGVMRYQAHNLCTYSEEIDNGAWGKNGTPTITANADGVAELWTPAASSTQHWIREPVYTAVAGETCVFSVRVKPNGYTNLQLFTGSTEAGTTSYCNFVLSGAGSKGTEGATATGSISAVGDGYYDLQLRVTLTGSTATAYFYLCAISSSTAVRNDTWTPDGASGYYVTRAHHYRYPANTDYIKTTSAAKYALPLEYDTSGNCLGMLVEEQRTNLLTYSSQFDNGAWTKPGAGVTVTANSVTAPNGNTDADLFTVASTGSFKYVVQSPSIDQSSTYTFSVFLKYASCQWIWLLGEVSGDRFGWFDVQNGVLGTAQAGITSKIENVGNGWYRCSITFTKSSATAVEGIGIGFANSDNTNAATAGQTVYVWNAQLELGSFPTSPIVTYGAAATRAADNISISTSAFPHSTTATTMFVHAIPLVDNSSNVMLEKAAASRGDSLTQLYTNGSGSLTAADRGAAFASQASFDEVATIDGLTAHKIAISCQTNLFDASINGSTEAQDTSGTHQANAHTILYIGSGGTGAIKGNIIKQVKVLPRVSSAAEMQTETA